MSAFGLRNATARLRILAVCLLVALPGGCDFIGNVVDAAKDLPGFRSKSGAAGLRVLTTPAPLYCGAQLDTDPLVFVFSKSMDASPITLPSPFDVETAGQAWSQTTVANDTLTLSPATLWTAGANPLNFTVNSAEGKQLLVFYTTNIFASGLPTLYYVSGDTGSDANLGTTPGTAYQTLIFALSAVTSPSVVLVAKTTMPLPGTMNLTDGSNPYKGYDASPTGLLLPDTVSLCGGFTPGFTARDPVANETVIVNTATTGVGTTLATIVTAITDPGVSTATVLEGFTLVAPGPDTITGYVENFGYTGPLQSAGGLQVRQNLLVSGGVYASVTAYVHDNGILANQALLTGNYLRASTVMLVSPNYGLYVSFAAPTFDSGYIGFSTAGVWISGTGAATATISNSDIDGGKSFSTFGIFVTGNGIVNILNNTEINGGGDGSSGQSAGITISAFSSATISGNALITGGINTSSTGIDINTAAIVTLTDNVIFGGTGTISSTAVRDLGTSTVIQYNVIHGGTGPTSTGIVSGNTTSPLYDGNTISGGSGSTPSGGTAAAIEIFGSATTLVQVTNNAISGCGQYGGALPYTCYGLKLNNGIGTTKIWNNTINGGTASGIPAPFSAAIVDNSSNTAGQGPNIVNNLLFNSGAGYACIFAANSLNIPDPAPGGAGVTNNILFNCGANRYFDPGLGDVALTGPITFGATPTTLQTQQNVFDLNPLFVSMGAEPGQADAPGVNWAVQATSPALVRGGGDDLWLSGSACRFKTDRNNSPRGLDSTAGNGWSIGAYTSPTMDTPDGVCP